MAFALRRRESAAAGLRRIGREEIAGLREDCTSPLGPEKIHGARKRCKALHALLRLLRGGLGADIRRAENARWRDLARSLGDARDAEVRRQTFAELTAGAGAFPELTRLLTAANEQAGQASFDRAKIKRLQAAIEQGLEAWEALPVAGHGWRLLAPGFRAGYRAARRGLHGAEESADDETMHDWRKAVKTHWHHLKLFQRFHPHALKKRTKQVAELAELLGQDHDLAVLRSWLQDHAPRSLAELDPLIGPRRRALQSDAFRLGEELFAEKPRVFSEDLQHGWRKRHR